MDTVADKLTALADAVRARTGKSEPLTLDGMAQGVEEVHAAGMDAEYHRFWDAYQQMGERSNYNNAFAGYGWTDEILNPKYPIACRTNLEMFKNAASITKTPEITSTERSTWTDAFAGARNLSEVYITGAIGRSIDFADCPLSTASMKRIIDVLAEIGVDNTCSVVFSDECWQALEEDGPAPDGGTWKDYVYGKGWMY